MDIGILIGLICAIVVLVGIGAAIFFGGYVTPSEDEDKWIEDYIKEYDSKNAKKNGGNNP